MKHTPGPWVTAKYSRKRFGLGNPGGSAWALIQTIYTDADDPEMIANARLIAAAPELLDALETIFEYMAYVPAYQIYSGPEETYDAAIGAHEDVERVKALLKRIYEGEDTE